MKNTLRDYFRLGAARPSPCVNVAGAPPLNGSAADVSPPGGHGSSAGAPPGSGLHESMHVDAAADPRLRAAAGRQGAGYGAAVIPTPQAQPGEPIRLGPGGTLPVVDDVGAEATIEPAAADTATAVARAAAAGKPVQLSASAQLLAGGVAGAISKTCTAPLARLTILQQVQGMKEEAKMIQGRASLAAGYTRSSIWEEAARILREEGALAFWKGNGVTILHRLPYSAINFYSYEKYQDLLLRGLGAEEGGPAAASLGLGMAVKLLAGGCAGCTAASLTYPLDLVRTRLAAQKRSTYYKGVWGTLGRIVRDEGVLGLYKGMGATLLGVGPNIAINFCVYETLKARWLLKHPETPPTLVSLACGSLAGIFSSTATFPLDLVRRRMQLEGAGGRAKVYNKGVAGMFAHIVKHEGTLALYRGIVPEYYKVVPGVSIAFMTYDYMKRKLKEVS